MTTMLRYPVKLIRDGETFRVECPDLPEVNTWGNTEAEALTRASDAIATALQGRITDREAIPAPSVTKRGHYPVALPALTAAKLALYRAMLETKTRKADLSRMLDVNPPQVDRLLDLDHHSRLDQIEQAARAMGCEIVIELRPVAVPPTKKRKRAA
jgi:antitoxin HicB